MLVVTAINLIKNCPTTIPTFSRLKTGVQIVGGVLAILSGVILVLFFAKLDEVCFDLHVVFSIFLPTSFFLSIRVLESWTRDGPCHMGTSDEDTSQLLYLYQIQNEYCIFNKYKNCICVKYKILPKGCSIQNVRKWGWPFWQRNQNFNWMS